MMIRVRGGDPMTVAPQVRQIAAAVDPSLRLVQIQRLNEVNDGMLWVIRLWMTLTAVMSSVALLLSLAGLYAVMAFTVSRRTREIGVRVALGGSWQRILIAIFRRPLIQMGLGVLAGITVIAAVTAWFPYTDGPGAGEARGLTPRDRDAGRLCLADVRRVHARLRRADTPRPRHGADRRLAHGVAINCTEGPGFGPPSRHLVESKLAERE